MNLMGRKKGNIMLEKSWDKMSIEEQERVRKEEQEKFSRMYPIVASANAIHANTAAAARKMAIEYWKKNHPNGVTINTIIGHKKHKRQPISWACSGEIGCSTNSKSWNGEGCVYFHNERF